MSKSLKSLKNCHVCRYSLLDTFAALAGLSIRSQPVRKLRTLQHSFQQRQLSTSRILRSEAFNETPQTPENPAEPPLAKAPIPWYLRVEPPAPLTPTPTPSSSLSPAPEIPPLPPNPPSILAPILHTLYQTLGLDALHLLDLRHLQPPPALGANLIMILATARSTKHLNVSADRFCRWCRASYKLRPFADGLLGRNELKLKLRRKARRQRLAASVGNTVDSRGLGGDDGITTGWICVNLGPVDEDDAAQSATPDEVTETLAGEEQGQEEYTNPMEGFVGFGSRSTAPRIVVQMFTEEKRAEMDLEGLWDVRQERRARREERGDAQAEEAVGDDEVDTAWAREVGAGSEDVAGTKDDFIEVRP